MLTTFNEGGYGRYHGRCAASTRKPSRRSTRACGSASTGFSSRRWWRRWPNSPAVNAEIDGDDIVYKHYVNMGIAVGGANGLVVPVIRDADAKSIAQIEAAISDFGKRAKDGTLKLEELSGGSFSITQWRGVRLADEHADPEPAAIGDSGDAQDTGTAGGDCREGRDPADDVPSRCPTTTASSTAGRRYLSWCGSRKAWKTQAACCWRSSLI